MARSKIIPVQVQPFIRVTVLAVSFMWAMKHLSFTHFMVAIYRWVVQFWFCRHGIMQYFLFVRGYSGGISVRDISRLCYFRAVNWAMQWCIGKEVCSLILSWCENGKDGRTLSVTRRCTQKKEMVNSIFDLWWQIRSNYLETWTDSKLLLVFI